MPLRVLLVDDDRRLSEALVDYLRPHDVSLTWARDGSEGLEQLRRDTFDAVLLDVMMPGLDGPSTFARLREQPATADIPVIFMTAKARQEELDRYQALGAIGAIGKPFDPMTLAATVRRLVER